MLSDVELRVARAPRFLAPTAICLLLATPSTPAAAAPVPASPDVTIDLDDVPIPIIGGEETEPAEFDGVVAIVAGNGLCTGTAVTPQLVLTAGHCLADIPDEAQVRVFFGDEIDMNMSVGVEDYGVHPSFCSTCEEDIYDYGYVVVSQNFIEPPGGFNQPIVSQEEWDEAMRVGAEVVVVGYGQDPAVEDGLGIKRKVRTQITRFSEMGLEFFAGGDKRDSCEGDSGGPALAVLPDGTVRLAGIVSRGTSPCGDGGFYGATYPMLRWVRDETGVELCGEGCPSCACVDTSPPAEDEGCGACRTGEDGDPSAPAAAGLLLALLAVRRRRRG